MASRTTAKRSGGSTGEGSATHLPKKTRFLEPDEDPTNFAEEVDAQLEDPSARRKGRVKIEGYESDSSDEGESVVLSRRAGAEPKDEDDDMFAMGEKEEKKEEETGKKEEEKYLRLGDIEGQEFGDKTGSGEEDESEPENEPEDEDEAERQKKAGMGFELTSFNMREEMEEGKFTEDGTYIRTYDPHAVHDKWLEGYDEKDIKKARRNRKHQERIQREKEKAEERELAQLGGKDEMCKALLPMLKKGETVLEALQRLGTLAKKQAAGNKKALKPNNKKRRDAADIGMDVDQPQQKTAIAPSEIDQITHLASTLMSLGETDVYSKTYEELVRTVRKSGKVDDSWQPPSADIKYEYKWDVPEADGGQVFGPFSEEEMHSWYKASYFGIAGEKVKVRPVEGEWGSWSDVVV